MYLFILCGFQPHTQYILTIAIPLLPLLLRDPFLPIGLSSLQVLLLYLLLYKLLSPNRDATMGMGVGPPTGAMRGHTPFTSNGQ